VCLHRLPGGDDLLLGAHVLAVALLGQGVQADRRVVSELRCDLDDRQPPSRMSSDANACRRSYGRAPARPTDSATGLQIRLRQLRQSGARQ
jgi:hypothetical protein